MSGVCREQSDTDTQERERGPECVRTGAAFTYTQKRPVKITTADVNSRYVQTNRTDVSRKSCKCRVNACVRGGKNNPAPADSCPCVHVRKRWFLCLLARYVTA